MEDRWLTLSQPPPVASTFTRGALIKHGWGSLLVYMVGVAPCGAALQQNLPGQDVLPPTEGLWVFPVVTFPMEP